jgi:hypothetical protein
MQLEVALSLGLYNLYIQIANPLICAVQQLALWHASLATGQQNEYSTACHVLLCHFDSQKCSKSATIVWKLNMSHMISTD